MILDWTCIGLKPVVLGCHIRDMCLTKFVKMVLFWTISFEFGVLRL